MIHVVSSIIPASPPSEVRRRKTPPPPFLRKGNSSGSLTDGLFPANKIVILGWPINYDGTDLLCPFSAWNGRSETARLESAHPLFIKIIAGALRPILYSLQMRSSFDSDGIILNLLPTTCWCQLFIDGSDDELLFGLENWKCNMQEIGIYFECYS